MFKKPRVYYNIIFTENKNKFKRLFDSHKHTHLKLFFCHINYFYYVQFEVNYS